MNALISAFKNKKTHILANDGRLIKKFFYGVLILTLAFQSGFTGRCS